MPIVVSRKTGQILSMPEYTQADYDRAWEALIRAYLKNHPEALAAPCGEVPQNAETRQPE